MQLKYPHDMLWVDAYGRRVEVILLDRADGHGPRKWIRVSWRGVLLGVGYYRTVDAALAHVDVESLVEVVILQRRHQETAMPDREGARVWAEELNEYMALTGWSAAETIEIGRERGHLCGVTLDPDHPDADPDHGVIASIAGWVVAYDGSVGSWEAR